MSCSPDELEPPWARFPWIQLGSIGWRMGSGEGYLMEWGDLTFPSVDAAIEYLHRHPPAPRSWKSWVSGWLAGIAGEELDDDSDEESPWDARVEEEGLIGEDAAYPVFVRNALAAGGLVVPWASERATPFKALRYSAREFGWWARWLTTECADRAAYLDAQPAAGSEWTNVARSARTGVPAQTGGVEGMVCILAATGTLPPPWVAGHEPRGPIEYDDSADARDHWLWWVTDTFEDAGSWQRYLAQWPAEPASWSKAREQHYLELR